MAQYCLHAKGMGTEITTLGLAHGNLPAFARAAIRRTSIRSAPQNKNRLVSLFVGPSAGTLLRQLIDFLANE